MCLHNFLVIFVLNLTLNMSYCDITVSKDTLYNSVNQNLGSTSLNDRIGSTSDVIKYRPNTNCTKCAYCDASLKNKICQVTYSNKMVCQLTCSEIQTQERDHQQGITKSVNDSLVQKQASNLFLRGMKRNLFIGHSVHFSSSDENEGHKFSVMSRVNRRSGSTSPTDNFTFDDPIVPEIVTIQCLPKQLILDYCNCTRQSELFSRLQTGGITSDRTLLTCSCDSNRPAITVESNEFNTRKLNLSVGWLSVFRFDKELLCRSNSFWLAFDPPDFSSLRFKIVSAIYAFVALAGCCGNSIVMYLFIR